MSQKLKKRAYERQYTIFFLNNGGEILYDTTTVASTRAEAKQWAVKFANDAQLLYDKVSVRQSTYDSHTSVAQYITRTEGVDALDAERTIIQINITKRQQQKMQKIFDLTGISIRHFSGLVRDEIDRLYAMYFDNEGKVKRTWR